MKQKKVNVDVMVGGRFYATIRTVVDTTPRFTSNDTMEDCFDYNELEREVFNRLPTLRNNKNVRFAIY